MNVKANSAAGKRSTCCLALMAIFYLSSESQGQNASAVNANRVEMSKAALSQVEVIKNVEYGQADGESLKLDVYQLPAQSDTLRPGVVFVHGGGWTGGDKGSWAAQARDLAAKGYVAVSVNYRLAPNHSYPANIEDVQRAVRWLRSQSAAYHVDTARLGAMGDSAGGHLATMLGVTDAKSDAAPFVSSRVQCVVDYYGRMDLTLDPTGTGGHDYRPAYIGKSKADALAAYRAASPIFHIDAQTCPILIVQGTHDPQVEPQQSKNMLAALDKANIESSLLLLNGQGHGFSGESARQAWAAACEFFDRHLKPTRPSAVQTANKL